MRPTFSIIAFTVLSGAGYGLLFLCGVALACGGSLTPYEVIPIDDFTFGRAPLSTEVQDPRILPGVLLAVGALLATAGLLASTAHLGQPLRAWRALSQWRSSWLSREGVLALVTYGPILALGWLVFVREPAAADGWIRVGGLLLALCSAATVYCTAHIYSSLKPVRAWNDAHVLPGYLLLGLYSGALWLVALAMLRIPGVPGVAASQWLWLANAVLVAPACAWLKRRYWRGLDTHVQIPSAGTATGLDRFGTVRSFEQPHTEENYLTHEMGFVLARKHSRKLRAIALWLILLAPLAMLPLAWLLGWSAAWLALIVGMTGLFIERWLFFAEAKHAVMAYYGR